MGKLAFLFPGQGSQKVGMGSDLRDARPDVYAGTVAPANLNTPTQIVVSGEEAGVVELMRLAEEAGADKVVRLQVGAAFHTVLMEPVQQRMRDAMAAVSFSDPDVPLVKQVLGMETDVSSVDSPAKVESFAARANAAPA